MKQKILLVGEPRICPQVAYVMDWQDFEIVEQLTDAEKYHDYKIVVCAFKNKKKSKRLVKIKDKALNIIYLDDICRELDAEEQQTQLLTNRSIKPVPLWRRIIDRVKTGEVGLAMIRRLKRHVHLRNFRLISKLPIETLSLSEMFIKVLYSQSTNIECTRLLEICQVGSGFGLDGCCFEFVPTFGNMVGADLLSPYNSYRARVIKLSALNHSYCLCKLHACKFADYAFAPVEIPPVLTSSPTPKSLTLSIDHSCNLRCATCRKDFYAADDVNQKALNELVTQILNSQWIRDIPYVILACEGEVFYSEAYQRLLENLDRKQIEIFSNGTLFNQVQWKKISAKYEQIDVAISVDAATAVTYQKIRGGDFKQLMQNLEMLGEQRKNGKIGNFQLNFLVQKDNYLEMADFVRLAKKLHADSVCFQRLNNWGTFSRKKYKQKSLSGNDRYFTPELYAVLQDPIFKDSIVDFTGLQPYLAASTKRYGG